MNVSDSGSSVHQYFCSDLVLAFCRLLNFDIQPTLTLYSVLFSAGLESLNSIHISHIFVYQSYCYV